MQADKVAIVTNLFSDRAPFRAALTGVANTILSFAVIALALELDAGNYAANAFGYLAGWCLSFVLYRHFVFASTKGNIRNEAIRFVGATSLAYAVNLLTLTIAQTLLKSPPLLSQAAAMGSYTATFFVVCRHFVFSHKRFQFSDDQCVWLTVALAAIGTLVGLSYLRLTHDVIWQFWIARQMAHGVGLYTDIIELNPPLWFWMALGIHKLATLFGIAPTFLLKALLTGWATLAVLLTDSFTHDARRGTRIGNALCLFAIATVFPIFDFGQREQLALIAGLPYATLIAARIQNNTIAKQKALMIGCLASAGFALKHYFLAAPLLLEILLLASLGKAYRPFRPETISLVGCAALYAVAVALFAPEFLSKIVPLVTLAYDGYERPILFQVLGRPQLLCYLTLITLFIYRAKVLSNPEATTYVISAVAFAFSFFAQHKGWQYHAIPMTGFLLMALSTTLTNSGKKYPYPSYMPLGTLVLIISFWTGTCWIGSYKNIYEDIYAQATRGLNSKEVVFTISNGPTMSWPMVDEKGLITPSRYFGFWPTGSIVFTPQSDPRRLALDKLANEIRQQTYHDVSCNPPKRILIESPMVSTRLRKANFRYKDFFEQYTPFKAFFAQYKLRERLPGMDVYVARPDARFPSKPSNCRKIY